MSLFFFKNQRRFLIRRTGLFLSLLTGFSLSAFSSSKSVTKEPEQPKIKVIELKREEQRKEFSARGVIIKFHHLPNPQQQKKIMEKLKAIGLKKTKTIKSFNSWLCEWSLGGLKPSRAGERACQEIKLLPVVKRCRPDYLLPLNRLQNFSKIRPDLKTPLLLTDLGIETEADFAGYCASCREKPTRLSPIPINIRTCKLLSYKQNLMDGQLSDYWAQEMIGSDLLREDLESASAPKRPNWISVFDTGQHGTAVKNLISDKGLHAVLPKLENEIAPFFDTPSPGKVMSHTADDLQKNPPYFINSSMGWLSEDTYEAFQKTSPPAVVVTAAGNDFPHNTIESLKVCASENFDTVIVGSFSPTGFVSDFSRSGKAIHITAPSDSWITSADKKGNSIKFAGTSGAAPLVTGGLAAFSWLSGYHPTPKEAKILLEKTAIPTLHSHEKPQINGVGLLNAYKLGEVGKRLKKKCQNKTSSCFKKEILNEANYRFKLDKNLKRDLGEVFPDCAPGQTLQTGPKAPDCEEKKRTFKKLRQAVLLNPKESKELLKSLSCIYREGGFSQNALALDNLALALGSQKEVRTAVQNLAEKQKPISDDLFRLMIGMGGFEEEFNPFEITMGIEMAGSIGKSGLPFLKEPLIPETLSYRRKRCNRQPP